MIYESPKMMTMIEIESMLASNDVEKICNALVSTAFYEPDWLWVQNKCLIFIENDDVYVSGLAATCLGHLARIHGKLEKIRVVNVLKSKLHIKSIAGSIDDALKDIELSMG